MSMFYCNRCERCRGHRTDKVQNSGIVSMSKVIGVCRTDKVQDSGIVSMNKGKEASDIEPYYLTH